MSDSNICKVVCQPEVIASFGAVTLINIFAFLFNIYKLACPRRRRIVSRSSVDHSQERSKLNFQKYLSQHQQQAQHMSEISSVVVPAAPDLEDGHSPYAPPPTIHSLPEVVDCKQIIPHRKLFVGRIEWGEYEGFLKEVSNPIEMVLHRKLCHKNVVSFYWNNMADKPKIELSEGVRQPPILFYCMEYCASGNLSTFLVNNGHMIDRTLMFDLIEDIVAGVNYLHSNQVAHRDIKSENILVQHTPVRFVAKIADFDHAINTSNEFEMSCETPGRRILFGSPLYMAPEFILGRITEPGAQDFFRHDMYSLGLVIWECLTWIKCRRRMRHQESESARGTDRTSLLPRNEPTTDLAQIRERVKCSSTVHIPLIKQICDTLKLEYCPKEKALRKNFVFLRAGRLIDTSLMKEFYTKVPDSRPTLFKTGGTAQYTAEINTVMEGCWKTEPSERLSVERVLELIKQIMLQLRYQDP